MIGKYTTLVASTSIRSPIVGSAGTGFIAVANDMDAATIKILTPKCIVAIKPITAIFFIILFFKCLYIQMPAISGKLNGTIQIRAPDCASLMVIAF